MLNKGSLCVWFMPGNQCLVWSVPSPGSRGQHLMVHGSFHLKIPITGMGHGLGIELSRAPQVY